MILGRWDSWWHGQVGRGELVGPRRFPEIGDCVYCPWLLAPEGADGGAVFEGHFAG